MATLYHDTFGRTQYPNTLIWIIYNYTWPIITFYDIYSHQSTLCSVYLRKLFMHSLTQEKTTARFQPGPAILHIHYRLTVGISISIAIACASLSTHFTWITSECTSCSYELYITVKIFKWQNHLNKKHFNPAVNRQDMTSQKFPYTVGNTCTDKLCTAAIVHFPWAK